MTKDAIGEKRYSSENVRSCDNERARMIYTREAVSGIKALSRARTPLIAFPLRDSRLSMYVLTAVFSFLRDSRREINERELSAIEVNAQHSH